MDVELNTKLEREKPPSEKKKKDTTSTTGHSDGPPSAVWRAGLSKSRAE